jgi:transcriptional/translational regulatory protein YebC/TACO1
MKVLEEAKSLGIANSTIESAIKRAKGTTEVEAVFEVRGAGRAAMIVEMVGKSKVCINKNLKYVFFAYAMARSAVGLGITFSTFTPVIVTK